ncbi:unnamed protein product [Cuscuta campestris]|uniref:Integrase catalytic domain-containing protein n=1 Tax=Cuscuta campestris TaxID=132261 RepID=A0A484L583_9ASTE|nr:unnamed protein product [Cuscuta campestris]
MVRIGRDLPGGLREEIISVLREYADIFAWSVADMPGIDRSVICHRLAMMEGSRPVKQKKRHLANVRRDFVKKEVKDLLAVGHIRELAKIESLDQSSTDRFEVAAIQPGQNSATGIIGADDDWRYDLMEYLETGQKPDDEERARKVVMRAPRFQVIDGHLYKRAIGGPLLRCLTNPEAERVIAEVHEGVCAAHQMSRTLAQRIILLGYYWPTIVGDCERYVQRCRTCQFRNPRFTEYLASFGIKHSKASVAYPQGNGQVENANRTIVDGLKKRLGEEGHKWLEALPHTVWAHRVTSRRATGETPFVLTYGFEARLPVEAEIPTFRETVYQPGQNEVDHLAELNLVEERRTLAAVKMPGYQ